MDAYVTTPTTPARNRPVVCLKPAQAAAKLGRGRTWLWIQLRVDPTFPAPVYIADKSPVWIEAELDAWILSRPRATAA